VSSSMNTPSTGDSSAPLRTTCACRLNGSTKAGTRGQAERQRRCSPTSAAG
jgi:hypothetical protein